MSFDLFNTLQGKILPPITDVIGKSSELVAWVAPFILLGVTLTLIIHGFEVVRGAGGHQYFLDALVKVARPVILLNLALLGGMYASTVVGFFLELRTDLSGLFGAKGANSYVAIDKAVSNGLDALTDLIPVANSQISLLSGNLQGLVIYVCLGVTALGLLFYAGVAAFHLVIVDASLALIFGVGPLFVASFAFQTTSRFFDSWLSAVLKYTLTAVFITVVIGLSNSLIQKFAAALVASTEASDFIGIAATSLCTAGLLAALIVRASALAADLVGGMAILLPGPGAVARTAAAVATPATRSAAYGGGAAAGAAGRAAVALGSAAGRTSLGVSVLKATEGMRASASSVASKTTAGVQNFGNAVAGRRMDSSGRMSSGHGIGNAFSIGRLAATASRSGTGTIGGAGGRPVPSQNWRD